MKQLLLILAFLLPLCAYPQLKEPFNGPEITSDNPWTGDLDCFVIENGWLVSRADPTRKSVSIETPLVYSATMEWEFEIRRQRQMCIRDRNGNLRFGWISNQAIKTISGYMFI